MSILNSNYPSRVKFLMIRNKGSNKVFGKNYHDLNEQQKEKIDKLMSKKYPNLKYEKLTNLEKCNFLQRKIILHSILYYELNVNIISDQQFDKMCKNLLIGIKHTKDYKMTDYYYVFYDFDGSTGFYLYHRLDENDKEYLLNLAQCIYNLYLQDQREKSKRGRN